MHVIFVGETADHNNQMCSLYLFVNKYMTHSTTVTQLIMPLLLYICFHCVIVLVERHYFPVYVDVYFVISSDSLYNCSPFFTGLVLEGLQ